MPFYAWQRHLVKLAFDLPFDHPLRTAFFLHLGAEYGREDGMVELWGDLLVNPSYLSPYTGVVGSLDPNVLGRGASPVIKLPASLAGWNLNRGLSGDFTRPAGTGRLDEFGNPENTPPSLLRQVGGAFAPRQTRSLQNFQSTLRYGEPVALYDSGDPYIVDGEPLAQDGVYDQGAMTPGRAAQAVAGDVFGIRTTGEAQLKNRADQKDKKLKRFETAGKTYERKLRRLNG
jgi:hypothetical protein